MANPNRRTISLPPGLQLSIEAGRCLAIGHGTCRFFVGHGPLPPHTHTRAIHGIAKRPPSSPPREANRPLQGLGPPRPLPATSLRPVKLPSRATAFGRLTSLLPRDRAPTRASPRASTLPWNAPSLPPAFAPLIPSQCLADRGRNRIENTHKGWCSLPRCTIFF